ncbi:MAG: thiamine pyrophosphate-binding protein [Verrucomicrobiota bacterium]
MNTSPTVGEYLIDRLQASGVGHVFGIPGDYVLGFYDLLARSALETVTTCDEQGAGFAADGYARLRGLGVVCVTYCVGGLKIANPVAGAFAEKSPVVVISGAPGVSERLRNPLLHHKVRDFETQKRVFDEITVASAVLDDPLTAFAEIDRVLFAAKRFKRPVYIELPRDMVDVRGGKGHTRKELQEPGDSEALKEALEEAVALLNRARKPVILADVEIHRFGLQKLALELIEKSGIPFATTILGKSVLGEQHPLYLGLYEGAMGLETVREYVESSDCVLMLGAFMTDINLGIYTARLDTARAISITSERLSIRYHTFENFGFEEFLKGLVEAASGSGGLRCREARLPPQEALPEFRCDPQSPLTVARLFHRLNSYLTDETIVVCDVGDALFGATDLRIHRRTEFLGPAYYASMGFAVPAAIGAEMANRALRPLVIVGDGAFQMTGVELSTVVRYGLKPIVLVLNNKGYGTERQMQDGPYNDVLPWHYSRMPELLGAGRGWRAETEGELETALAEAAANTASFSLIDVCLDQSDRSPALGRLASHLAKRLGGGGG